MKKIIKIIVILIFISFLKVLALDNNHNKYLLSKHTAGFIKTGMTVNELYKLHDRKLITLVDLHLEGYFSPALEIRLNDNDTSVAVIAEICSEKNWPIYRLVVKSDKFKTKEDIGIGNSLGDIRRKYKIKWIRHGDANGLFVRVEDLQMSFIVEGGKIPKKWYKTRDQNLISDNFKITGILIN